MTAIGLDHFLGDDGKICVERKDTVKITDEACINEKTKLTGKIEQKQSKINELKNDLTKLKKAHEDLEKSQQAHNELNEINIYYQQQSQELQKTVTKSNIALTSDVGWSPVVTLAGEMAETSSVQKNEEYEN